jgi:hypothetical protein
LYRYRFQQRVSGYSKYNYHTNRHTSRVKQHQKTENNNDNKRMKLLEEEAKRFGLAFGAAWKAAYWS